MSKYLHGLLLRVKIWPFSHRCISQNHIFGSPQKFTVEQVEVVRDIDSIALKDLVFIIISYLTLCWRNRSVVRDIAAMVTDLVFIIIFRIALC